MKIAITGGTGFIGRHVALDLLERGQAVTVISRGLYTRNAQSIPGAQAAQADVTDTAELGKALAGAEVVVDCAGTSVEDNSQTFQHVHVDGARSLVEAARAARVKKIVLVSYVTVRPGTRSAYYDTKWQGEAIIRSSGLNFVIIKAGLVYGPGDHMLNNLGNLFHRMPIFATVGIRERTVRPVSIDDLVAVIRVAATDDRLSRQILVVTGPEELPFSTVARKIARAMGRPFLLVLPAPVLFQRMLAWFSQRFMARPLITPSQVDMLADGDAIAAPDLQELPADIKPNTLFSEEQIRKGLPTF
jgi:nucleoside-diphosphate-sugar epimerase